MSELKARGLLTREEKIWNAVTGKHILTCKDCSVAPINAVAWSPDGTRLASASSDNTVHVWDAHTGSLLHSYTGHSSSVLAVAWSPDGRRLASASSNTVHVWDAHRDPLLHSYAGHSDSVNAVAWSPDGYRLASGADNGVVVVWQAV